MRKSLALVFLVYLFSFSIAHSMEEEKQNLGFYLHIEHMKDSTSCSFYGDGVKVESFLIEEGSLYQNHFSNSMKVICDEKIDYIELIVYKHGSSKNIYESFLLNENVVEFKVEKTNSLNIFYSFPLFIVFFTLVMYIKNYSTRIDEEDPYL